MWEKRPFFVLILCAPATLDPLIGVHVGVHVGVHAGAIGASSAVSRVAMSRVAVSRVTVGRAAACRASVLGGAARELVPLQRPERRRRADEQLVDQVRLRRERLVRVRLPPAALASSKGEGRAALAAHPCEGSPRLDAHEDALPCGGDEPRARERAGRTRAAAALAIGERMLDIKGCTTAGRINTLMPMAKRCIGM